MAEETSPEIYQTSTNPPPSVHNDIFHKFGLCCDGCFDSCCNVMEKCFDCSCCMCLLKLLCCESCPCDDRYCGSCGFCGNFANCGGGGCGCDCDCND